MDAWKGGICTGRKHCHGDQGALSSFSESGPTNPAPKEQGPTFSHAVKNGGPNGVGTVGEKGSFKPY